MTVLKLAGRTVAMIVGILGAVVALVVTIINFGVKNIEAGSLGNAHTPTGLGMTLLAFIGALIALPFPTVSAILMLIAGIVMVLVAGWLGVIPLIIMALAALFAFLDRPSRRAARA